jgi:hypothetical protein
LSATLANLAGPRLWPTLSAALHPWEVVGISRDLDRLSGFLEPASIRRHYLRDLPKNKYGTIAEIFVAARLSRHVIDLLPHVAGPKARNFDVIAVFESEWYLAVECKHQVDRSPFDGHTFTTDEGLVLYESIRPGADPRYLDQAATTDVTHSLPVSSIWREAVVEAIPQLPPSLPSMVALSIDDFGPIEDDLEDALYGDSVLVGRPAGHRSSITTERLANGVFAQPQYAHLVAVWAFRLRPHSLSEDGIPTDLGCDFARLYLNPNACYTAPPSLRMALKDVRDFRPEPLDA